MELCGILGCERPNNGGTITVAVEDTLDHSLRELEVAVCARHREVLGLEHLFGYSLPPAVAGR